MKRRKKKKTLKIGLLKTNRRESVETQALFFGLYEVMSADLFPFCIGGTHDL